MTHPTLPPPNARAHRDLTPRSLTRTLAVLLAGAALAVGLQAHDEGAHADFYAYGLSSSESGDLCGYDFVSLDAAGQAVPMSARPGAAGDDRGALLPLDQPFELYQSPTRSLVVSDNGYLAVADTLEREDGSDFSNDCGLPVLADNPAASQNRIYVYHDDLRPQSGGGLRQAHFPVCPRTAGSGRPEPCTVVEWNRFERASPIRSTVPLVAQAVLYHDSHEIALQYASVDDSQGGQATVGLQGFDGRTARQASCDTPRRIRAKQAVCFFDPRQRAGNGALAAVPPR